MSAKPGHTFKGAPLALFAVLLCSWIGGRVMLWDDSWLEPATASGQNAADSEAASSARSTIVAPRVTEAAQVRILPVAQPLPQPNAAVIPAIEVPTPAAKARSKGRALRSLARAADVSGPGEPVVQAPLPSLAQRPAAGPISPVRPGFAAPYSVKSPVTPPVTMLAAPPADRWSVDAWGFWRQGSDAAPVSQGRVPIYGASQIGAIGQFRVTPHSSADLRLYARAYRALVVRGETEVSFGGSLRPVSALPIRTFAEMRYTQTPFGNDWRPAAFMVTELPPQSLPAGLQLEAYGQAGWVGGDFATAFADGQMSVVRKVARFPARGSTPARLSVGAGAWGGAQKDASRLDVGPTLRLDWTMGRVPARFSVDWREQVSGDAAPESGLAATLSTSF